MRPDEDEDKFDHDPDGTGWELNTSEMTPKHMRDIPRRIRCLPFDVPWSQKTADSLAEEVALVVEMALLPPNAGADIAAKAGVNAALANLGRALKAEAHLEALERRERVGDRMHDFLCRLFSNPRLLPESFAPEAWALMQDWTAPPPEAALRSEEET